MDILDAFINFIRVTDSTSLLKKKYQILIDRDDYVGERIKALFSLLMLILCYTGIIVFLIYLILKFLTK